MLALLCSVIIATGLLKCHNILRAQSRSETWVGAGHGSSIGPLYRRGCEAPGYRLEAGGD